MVTVVELSSVRMRMMSSSMIAEVTGSKPGVGLVEEEDVRLVGDRAREADAAAHSARKLGREPIFGAGQLNELRGTPRRAAGSGLGRNREYA